MVACCVEVFVTDTALMPYYVSTIVLFVQLVSHNGYVHQKEVVCFFAFDLWLH